MASIMVKIKLGFLWQKKYMDHQHQCYDKSYLRYLYNHHGTQERVSCKRERIFPPFSNVRTYQLEEK